MTVTVPDKTEFDALTARVSTLETKVKALEEQPTSPGEPTQPPTPTPTPPPTGTKKITLVHGPDWQFNQGGNSTSQMQRDLISDYSIFVYVPAANGASFTNLGNEATKKQFSDWFHAGGKKCTMSIGGGGTSFPKTQMQTILGSATARQNLANLCKSTCQSQGYDGVKIDFEWYDVTNPNGTKNEDNMLDLIKKLRAALGTGKIISMDLIFNNNGIITAGNQYPSYVDYFAPMIYDIAVPDVNTVKNYMNKWATVLPKAKLLAGLAQKDITQTVFAQVLDFINADGYGGMANWTATSLTAAWYGIIRDKFGTVA